MPYNYVQNLCKIAKYGNLKTINEKVIEIFLKKDTK